MKLHYHKRSTCLPLEVDVAFLLQLSQVGGPQRLGNDVKVPHVTLHICHLVLIPGFDVYKSPGLHVCKFHCLFELLEAYFHFFPQGCRQIAPPSRLGTGPRIGGRHNSLQVVVSKVLFNNAVRRTAEGGIKIQPPSAPSHI